MDSVDADIYASAVIHGKIIYAVADHAVIYTIDAATGPLVYGGPLPIAPWVETEEEV